MGTVNTTLASSSQLDTTPLGETMRTALTGILGTTALTVGLLTGIPQVAQAVQAPTPEVTTTYDAPKAIDITPGIDISVSGGLSSSFIATYSGTPYTITIYTQNDPLVLDVFHGTTTDNGQNIVASILGNSTPAPNGGRTYQLPYSSPMVAGDAYTFLLVPQDNGTIGIGTPGGGLTYHKQSDGSLTTLPDIQIAATLTVQTDSTGPQLPNSYSPATPDGNNGWYKTFPTVSYTCSDTGVGVKTCPAPQTATSDGTFSATATAIDNVGNSATVTTPTIKIDTHGPLVKVTGPTNHGKYTVGLVPKLGCAISDKTSGAKSCKVFVSGTYTKAGTYQAYAVGEDNAGNRTTTQKISFEVAPKVTVAFPKGNTVKAGATIRIKVNVTDATGHPLSGTNPHYLLPVQASGQNRPGLPKVDGGPLHQAKDGSWYVNITLEPSMSQHAWWTFGVKVGSKTYTQTYKVVK